MKQKQTPCALCNSTAAIYCAADSAHLCFACDRRVHSDNFLAARHVRHLLSDPSHSLTGPGTNGPEPSTSACSSISSVDHHSASTSLQRRVLESWGKRMGIKKWRRCADVAMSVLQTGRVRVKVLGCRRVEMAAAMWVGARVCCEGGTCEMLRKLERCSGVPCRVILVICEEGFLARAAERRRRREAGGKVDHDVEEGWGES